MRSTKIVSALVALVLGFSIVGLVVTPAQAAKPKHDVTATPGTSPSGATFISGKVSTFPNGTITIQRKVPGKAYVNYKRPTTNNKGKYRQTVSGPAGSCFKVVVPKTKNYKLTKVFVACFQG
jgi:hypothetical protein